MRGPHTSDKDIACRAKMMATTLQDVSRIFRSLRTLCVERQDDFESTLRESLGLDNDLTIPIMSVTTPIQDIPRSATVCA